MAASEAVSSEAEAFPGTRKPQEADEVRLLRLVAAGDLPAFERLYRLYRPRLARFLDRMLRRPPLVEEVLDDTLLVVWHAAGRYAEGGSKVSTWIFAIAYRKALKALARLDKPPAFDDAWGEGGDGDRGGSGGCDGGGGRGGRSGRGDGVDAERADLVAPNPEQRLSRGQLLAALARALDELSAEQRAVVELAYFHGIGYREIAAIAGCPVDTVKTRMFHARRRLRGLLGGTLEDWL